MKKLILFILTLHSLFWQNYAKAEQDNLDYIFDMSLEALLNVSIKSASKKEELIEPSPGVITVITAKQIKELGARNLDGVLNGKTGRLKPCPEACHVHGLLVFNIVGNYFETRH